MGLFVQSRNLLLPPGQQTGLIGHWPLDGDVQDRSPYQVNSLQSTPAFVRYAQGLSQNSRAMFFDGAAYLDCGPTPLAVFDGPAVTMMAWVYFDSTPAWGVGKFPAVMGNFCNTPMYSGVSILFGDSGTSPPYGFYWQGGTSSASTESTLAATPPVQGWQHVCAASADGRATGTEIYINGVNATATRNSPVFFLQAPTTVNWTIGQLADFTSICAMPAGSRIADARVYNRQLSAEEVYAIYNWRRLRKQLTFGLVPTSGAVAGSPYGFGQFISVTP